MTFRDFVQRTAAIKIPTGLSVIKLLYVFNRVGNRYLQGFVFNEYQMIIEGIITDKYGQASIGKPISSSNDTREYLVHISNEKIIIEVLLELRNLQSRRCAFLEYNNSTKKYIEVSEILTNII